MKTTKLTDTQLVLLNAAAQRDNGRLLPIPATVSAKPPQIKKAIEILLSQRLVAETPVTTPAEVWRQDEDQRVGLIITDDGRKAIDAPAVEDTPAPPANTATHGEGAVAADEGQRGSGSRGAKQELLVTMLARPEGASIEEITAATSWLPHSARAMLTGLRKRGFTVSSGKADGIRRYHATSAEAAQ